MWPSVTISVSLSPVDSSLHLPTIKISILLLLPSSLLSYIFWTPCLIRSYYVFKPFQSLLISATMSRSLHVAHFLIFFLFSIFLPLPLVHLSFFLFHVPRLSYPFQSQAMFHPHCATTGFTVILRILIVTALLMAVDLNLCLRVQKHLLPTAILYFSS